MHRVGGLLPRGEQASKEGLMAVIPGDRPRTIVVAEIMRPRRVSAGRQFRSRT